MNQPEHDPSSWGIALPHSQSDTPLSGTFALVSKRPLTTRGAILGGMRQITRNRASYSCHTCRRRKVRCDKVHPVCGSCLKNSSECVYNTIPGRNANTHSRDKEVRSHGVKRRREASTSSGGAVAEQGSPPRGPGELYDNRLPAQPEPGYGSDEIRARLDKLKAAIETLNKAKDPFTVDGLSRQQHLVSSEVEPAPRDATESHAGLEHGSKEKLSLHSRQDSPRRIADSSDEFPIPSGNATDPVDPIGSLNLGHLSLEDGGKSRYVGTTYWAFISDEINELNRLLREQNRSHAVSAPDESHDEGAVGDKRTPTRAEMPTRSNRRKSDRFDDFPVSVLFFPGDSSPAREKAIEPQMLEHVPSRKQSDILYKGFMAGVHAISPVLHPPTILEIYNLFWEWYDHKSFLSGEQFSHLSFIPLLYAIWYGGSVTISIRTVKAEFDVSSRSELSDLFHDQVTLWLTRISFPRSPSLYGLAAFLIVQTILSKEEEPLTSSLFISLSLRVAQTMGLHRDPAQFGITSCEAESRRRVWWHIVHMDGVVAMSSGLPPLVSDENYWDVRETSEVKDTLLGTPRADKYESSVAKNLQPPDNPDDPTICGGPSMVNIYYLSARGKYIMARAIRKILKIQLGTRLITRNDMEELRSILVDLQIKLNSIINRIPHPRATSNDSDTSRLGTCTFDSSQSHSHPLTDPRSEESILPGDISSGCSEQYHSPVLVAFHKWARILLSLFINKAFCVAYQPFLKNVKSRIWPAARQGALQHCHGFMEKFISLATDPDFQPFQWSWPGNHQPMHATMIMLIDLYERPNSPEASRSRAFIDKTFSLSGPDGGVVGGEDGITTQRPLKDGGREAWDMMRRLREKAWQKAGLDPHQLWTEQAQIEVGVAAVHGGIPNLSRIGTADGYRQLQNPLDYYRTRNLVSGATSQGMKSDSHPIDFPNTFFDLTRAHETPSPTVSSLRHEPPPYSSRMLSSVTHSQSQLPPQPTLQEPWDPALPCSPVVSRPNILHPVTTKADQPDAAIDSSTSPFLFNSVLSPYNNQPVMASGMFTGPPPPSMMDPCYTFDWDQWDAVFGQQLPVADEFMELDSVAGVGLSDMGVVMGLDHTGAMNSWDACGPRANGDIGAWSDFG